MECPHCKQMNAEDAAFCNHCGSQLHIHCTSCATVNPLGSKYCSQCGADLDVQASSGGSFSGPGQVSTPTTLLCPRCSSVNEPGSLYCYNCGLPLDDAEHQLPGYGRGAYAQGRPAGFWIRVVASIIDGVLLTAVISALVALFFGENYFSEEEDLRWSDGLAQLASVAYYTLGVALFAATVGKRVLKMQVIRPDGSRVGLGRAFARYFASILSALILTIGLLMVAFRRDKRGLHDLICDTVVIIRH